MIKARHVIGLLLVLLLVSGCSLFGQNEELPPDDELPLTPEVLKITAPANVYAHIYRPFPEVDDAASIEELIVEGRFLPVGAAGSSWVGQLGLYWETGELVSIGAEVSGQVRMVGIGAGIGGRVPEVIDAEVTWKDLRIHLTESRIEMWARGDDDWIFVRGVDRPTSMAGLPVEVIVGKGFQATSAPYDTPHLDNSIVDEETGPGAVGTNYIDDVVVVVDGNTLFHEEFNDLEGWEMHADPTYESQITFEIAPSPRL